MASYFRQKIIDSDCLVFFDLEATQFGHHAIAIGMVIVPKRPGTLWETYGEPITYKRYLTTEEAIGKVVIDMTGITKEILDKEGIPFGESIKEINDLLRPFRRCVYLSYGKEDVMFIQRTLDFRQRYQGAFFAQLTHHYLDLQTYLGHYLIGERNNFLSVSRLMALYGIEPRGNYHDPLTDSYAIEDILKAFYEQKDRTLFLILDNYERLRKIPGLDKKLALCCLRHDTRDPEEILWEAL